MASSAPFCVAAFIPGGNVSASPSAAASPAPITDFLSLGPIPGIKPSISPNAVVIITITAPIIPATACKILSVLFLINIANVFIIWIIPLPILTANIGISARMADTSWLNNVTIPLINTSDDLRIPLTKAAIKSAPILTNSLRLLAIAEAKPVIKPPTKVPIALPKEGPSLPSASSIPPRPSTNFVPCVMTTVASAAIADTTNVAPSPKANDANENELSSPDKARTPGRINCAPNAAANSTPNAAPMPITPAATTCHGRVPKIAIGPTIKFKATPIAIKDADPPEPPNLDISILIPAKIANAAPIPINPCINLGHGKNPNATIGNIAKFRATPIAIKFKVPLLPPNFSNATLSIVISKRIAPTDRIPCIATSKGNNPKAIIGNTAKLSASAKPVKLTIDWVSSNFIV